jgi:hypothetical protein
MKGFINLIKKTTLLSLGFILITALIPSYKHGSSILYSTPSTYGRGWPIPYLVWDISSWPEGVNESLSLQQLAHQYSYNNVFLIEYSVIGLLLSFIFWLLVSFLLMGIKYLYTTIIRGRRM